MDYRYGSHRVYQIEYHFVWVTKYRYKVLSGELASDFHRQRHGGTPWVGVWPDWELLVAVQLTVVTAVTG